MFHSFKPTVAIVLHVSVRYALADYYCFSHHLRGTEEGVRAFWLYGPVCPRTVLGAGFLSILLPALPGHLQQG